MNGAIMQRIIGLAVATFAFSTLNGVPAVANSATTGDANAFAQVRVNVRVRSQSVLAYSTPNLCLPSSLR